MLSEQAIIAEPGPSTTDTMHLGFIISDDGRTLLAVTERDDGVLEFMTVPVASMQQGNIVTPSIKATADGNLMINQPIFQISLDGISGAANQQAALLPAQTIQALPIIQEEVQSSDIPKEIRIETNNIIRITPTTDPECSRLRTHEIAPETTNQSPVIKRSPGRPRKDGSSPPTKPPNILKCEICGKVFNKQMLLRRHLEQHAEEKPHRCPKCTASFNVPTNFTLHMATHNTGEPKCPECGRKFSRMASLKSHMLLHYKEENLFCSECEDGFSTKAQLDAHLKLHNEKWSTEDVRKCKLCNKQFTQPALYRLHIREHYRLQTKIVKHTKRGAKHKTMYKCKICLKSFQKPSQLARHIRVHTGEKPFKCTICSRAFTQKGSLQIHMVKHNGFRPHNCTYCCAKFTQKGNLRAHIRKVHSIPEGQPVYSCQYCACIFSRLGSLNGHMAKMHTNPVTELTQNCDSSTEADMQATVDTVMSQLASLECPVKNSADSTGNNASENDILQQALRNSGLPSKEKITPKETSALKQGEASTTFVTLLDRPVDSSSRKYVTIKQRSIGNIRWYTCSYCFKEFKKPSDLIRHLRIHTQEKPFKCSYCTRSFAVKSSMLVHERSHMGTKKYVCNVCDTSFNCHSSLAAHTRSHMGTTLLTCTVCDKSFKASALLKSHMRSHKKGKKKLCPEAARLVPQIVLEEPLVITDAGDKISVVQVQSKNQQHYNSNDVARPHKCWVCPAAFRKISHLKQHYHRHTGERPYKCQKCDRRFTSNSVMKAHLRTHEGARPFSCSVCSATFSTQSGMKRHITTHSNKRPFMCPYCHKTFKTSVNCRKHMKSHKQELAERQLEQQRSQQEPQLVSQLDEKSEIPALAESLTLTDEIEVTFQPQMAPDFTQAFSDQFHTMAVDKDRTLMPQNNTMQTIVDQSLPIAEPMNLGSSQTLHADETGTITLPNYSGDQTLTPESIREIEETLNQQLFNIGMNLGLGGNLTRQMNETTSSSLETGEQPVLNIIYENTKGLESSTAGAMNTGIFPSQFDTFDMSQITLQADAEMDIGINSANSTSMASILPRSAQEEQHLVTVSTTTTDDNQSKHSRHHVVVSSMQTCPELSRPVQACPKYPKVIAKADTTDGSDTQYTEGGLAERSEGKSLPTEVAQHTHSIKCDLCDKYFQKQIQAKAHRKTHFVLETVEPEPDELITIPDPDSQLLCHMCSKRGFTAATLKEHLKTHRGKKEFQCTECTLKFCTNGGLSRHLKMHANKLQLKCPICDETFPNKSQLKSHAQMHENNSKIDLVEPDSSQKESFITNGNCISFTEIPIENTPVSEKVLMEAVAEKKIIDEENSDEVKKEKKEYTNKCIYCPKTFRKPSDLVRHVRTHTGERPYQCEYCNKSFAVKCTLDCHMKVHTGKKTFACHVCNRLFSTKGSLKVHMRLHTGSKPFRCPQCDLRFRTSGHRKIHLLSHLREQKYPSKAKPKQRKVAAIAGVAAELEKTVENLTSAENNQENITKPSTNETQPAEYPNLDSITIDTSGLADHITFNADGTILNNNNMLSVNESNQLVANLHFLLANGLVTIQTDDNLLQQLPNADPNVIQNHAGVSELIITDSLREPTCNDTSPPNIVIETDISADPIAQSEDTLQMQNCMTVNDANDISQLLVKTVEDNVKPTPATKSTQARKECDVCGKLFMKPCQLERHKRVHTGERPFKCTLCSKSFAQNSTLQVHQKHHTGERPYLCPHCNFSFAQKCNLKTHLKRVHQLDTLEVQKLRRGQQVLSVKLTPENVDETRILGLDDISLVDFLK